MVQIDGKTEAQDQSLGKSKIHVALNPSLCFYTVDNIQVTNFSKTIYPDNTGAWSITLYATDELIADSATPYYDFVIGGVTAKRHVLSTSGSPQNFNDLPKA
jgi:hypothetical protein